MIVASILSPLEDILRNVLDFFHNSGHLTWAWSIVALTVTVRVLLVPLAVRQIHSMQRMQAHAPQMKEIQRKYKGDRQKMNEELMAFYKENNINPAASCLPLVAQLPVFFSLYFVLRNFSKHVPAGSDLSWLNIVPDIAAPANSHWSGYLLLAIYAGSQVSSTLLMPNTMPRSQRALFVVLPLVFITVVARFPTGLVIYWVTTNLWTVGQGVITRRLVPKQPPPPPKKSSRTPPKETAPASEAKPAGAKPAGQPRRVRRKKKGARR